MSSHAYPSTVHDCLILYKFNNIYHRISKLSKTNWNRCSPHIKNNIIILYLRLSAIDYKFSQTHTFTVKPYCDFTNVMFSRRWALYLDNTVTNWGKWSLLWPVLVGRIFPFKLSDLPYYTKFLIIPCNFLKPIRHLEM